MFTTLDASSTTLPANPAELTETDFSEFISWGPRPKKDSPSAEIAVIGSVSQSHPSPRPSPREGRGSKPGAALFVRTRDVFPLSPHGERAGVRGAIFHDGPHALNS